MCGWNGYTFRHLRLYDKVGFQAPNYMNSPSFLSFQYFTSPSIYISEFTWFGGLKNDFKNGLCDPFKVLYQLATSAFGYTFRLLRLYDKVCFQAPNYMNSPSFLSSQYFTSPNIYISEFTWFGGLKNDFKNGLCDPFKVLYQLATSGGFFNLDINFELILKQIIIMNRVFYVKLYE